MLNYKIDNEKAADEIRIQNDLFNYVNSNQSFVFKAGAGVGKTYALKETIKYILELKRVRFGNTGEKIRVITFTNAATDEILKRIGQNENLKCSTIHEFAWEIISSYPTELLQMHLDQIIEETKNKEKKMDYYQFTNFLKTHEKEQVMEFQTNPLFYELSTAQSIRDFFGIDGGDAGKFYEAFKAYFSKIKLEETKNRIVEYLSTKPLRIKKEFFVKYDVNSNIKNLNKMRIDHDLCLLYFRKMFEKYALISKAISSKYPYLLIDEYQDTDEAILKSASDMIRNPNCHILIGFFGDEIQNIYSKENDVINELEKNKLIASKYKKYNRRCSEQVIKVGNRINHNYQQESIYSDHNDGEIKIINLEGKTLQSCLLDLSTEYGKIDCLILKNQTIAGQIGITDIYDFYKDTKEYSGIYFGNLNTELLHHDLEKLGKTQRIIFSLLNLFKCVDCSNIFLNELFDENYKLSKKECCEILFKLKDLKTKILDNTKLGDFMDYLFSVLDKDTPAARSITKKTFGGEYSLIEIKQDISDNTHHKEGKSIFDIRLDSFLKWYDYIIEKQENNINYHTYHITKGLEYDNVVIVIEDKYRKENDIFNFLKNCVDAIKTNDYQRVDQDKTFRNLFYVAITRSKKNLFIINMGSLEKEELQVIFF